MRILFKLTIEIEMERRTKNGDEVKRYSQSLTKEERKSESVHFIVGRVVESVSSLSLSLSFFPLCPHKKKEKCDNNILILDTALFVGGLPSGDLFSVLIDPAERSKTKKQIHCSSNYYYYPRKKVCLGLTINDRLLLLSIRRGREAKRERKKEYSGDEQQRLVTNDLCVVLLDQK